MSSNNRLGVEGSNPYSPRYKASVPSNELPCQVHVTIYSYTCKLRVYTQSLTQENLKSAFLRTLASISWACLHSPRRLYHRVYSAERKPVTNATFTEDLKTNNGKDRRIHGSIHGSVHVPTGSLTHGN